MSSRTVLMSTHNLCFEQKYEKYQIFLSENFPFLVVKFSLYLNRRVFVMFGSVAFFFFFFSICTCNKTVGRVANIVGSGQTPQNAASVLCVHCF